MFVYLHSRFERCTGNMCLFALLKCLFYLVFLCYLIAHSICAKLRSAVVISAQSWVFSQAVQAGFLQCLGWAIANLRLTGSCHGGYRRGVYDVFDESFSKTHFCSVKQYRCVFFAVQCVKVFVVKAASCGSSCKKLPCLGVASSTSLWIHRTDYVDDSSFFGSVGSSVLHTCRRLQDRLLRCLFSHLRLFS